MNKKKIEMWKFRTLIKDFMGRIALDYRDQMLDDTIDALLAYLADLCTNGTYSELYEETYEKISGTPGGEDFYLTQEETFTLVIEVCALHICHWGFRMKEVLALLFAMRYDPENNKKDITIWNELVNVAL